MVYSSKDAPGLITDVLVFKKEFIKEKPDVVKALIQGYIDGLDYMKKNPDKAAEIIGKAIGVSAAEVKEQLSGVYNLEARELTKVFDKKAKDTTSFYVSGVLIGDILKAKGQISAVAENRGHLRRLDPERHDEEVNGQGPPRGGPCQRRTKRDMHESSSFAHRTAPG